MNLEPTEIIQILERLARKTQTPNGLSWEVSAHEPDEYLTKSRRFRYYVRSRDGDGAAPYIFEIYYPESQKPGPELVVDSGAEDARKALSELYQIARRSASGFVDGLATEVLRDLEDDPF
ncbi:hypothetical protein [Microbacterium sp. NPDC058389]|uniref:hypothetical protein n=1 Tax=Microbacterium sp. NPDC058389 TaxID=3346475 RepID=UPI00364BB87E